MSQFDMPTIVATANTGTQLSDWLNQWQDAVESTHAGPVRPPYVKPGMLWIQQLTATDWKLFCWDGTHDILLIQFNPTTGNPVGQFLPLTAGAANPLTGDLFISGNSRRISGDMSNANFALRLSFQTNILNGGTAIQALPNGTSVIGQLLAWNNSNPADAAYLLAQCDATRVIIASGKTGAGVALPFAIDVNGAERFRINTAGRAGISAIPPAWGGGWSASLDLGDSSAIANANTGGPAIAGNAYNDGAWKRKIAGYALLSSWNTNQGVYEWYVATTAAAGSAIGFVLAMQLNNNGNLGLGSPSGAGTRLNIISQDSTSASYALGLSNFAGVSLTLVRSDGLMLTGDAALSPRNLTTAVAANCVIEPSNGALQRSTSSLRYKREITPYTRGIEDAKKLAAVFFKSITREGDEPNETQYAGFTAEAVHEAGLTEFVSYDAEGRPDALHYANMGALFNNCILELETRLAAIESGTVHLCGPR